jgi:hypothetical protein
MATKKTDKKKRLTKDQEFEILKLVIDKFLWLGFGVMAYGLYIAISVGLPRLIDSLVIIASGAIILILLINILVKEYEIIK